MDIINLIGIERVRFNKDDLIKIFKQVEGTIKPNGLLTKFSEQNVPVLNLGAKANLEFIQPTVSVRKNSESLRKGSESLRKNSESYTKKHKDEVSDKEMFCIKFFKGQVLREGKEGTSYN